MNRLHINHKYCKGCHICINFCPKSSLKASEKKNEKGYFVPIEADMERCTTCFICEIMCPDFAIAIEKDIE